MLQTVIRVVRRVTLCLVVRVLAATGVLLALMLPVVWSAPRTLPRPLLRTVHGQSVRVALAYIHQDTVTLADGEGNPLVQPGPTFSYGQGARLLWTPDGRMLYVARADGLYTTGATGGAAVRLPGDYGRTLTIAQDAETLYYLETISPQPLEDDLAGLVSFPIREIPLVLLSGDAGRLAGYFGRFDAGAAQAELNFAAALYARDGGLLGPGRPHLWPTYGTNVFGTCCFPRPGLGRFDIATGEFAIDDETFLPGAAALNLTRTHLAGPATDGAIRVIDLITGGVRDYVIEIAGGLGVIERMAWSPDDTYLYFVTRGVPANPLQLTEAGPFPVDTRSADITLYRLNLVTSVIRELATRQDVYGVSALAATADYVFAVVVDSNRALVEAINARQVPLDAAPTNPDLLNRYLPATHLWRVESDGDSASDVLDGVWGVAARPIR